MSNDKAKTPRWICSITGSDFGLWAWKVNTGLITFNGVEAKFEDAQKRIAEKFEKKVGPLPCPFCNGDVEIRSGETSKLLNTAYWVACANDGCMVEPVMATRFHDEKGAISAWNERMK